MRNLRKTHVMLDVNLLNVDSRYQRPVKEKMVRKMSKTFNADASGSLCVGVRNDGSYWVVDGFQRLTTAISLGIDRLPCDLFSSRGVQHEAEIFGLKNTGRTAVTAPEKFRASLAAKDSEAMEIKQLIEDNGFILELNSHNSVWPRLNCVAAVQAVFRKGGEELLSCILDVVNEAWPEEPDALRASIISGLAVVLHKGGHVIDVDRLISVLSLVHPLRIISKSQILGDGFSKRVSMARAIMWHYNKRLRKHNKVMLDLD